jgi:putative transposase
MYEYQKLTPTQRKQLVQERVAKGFPPHAPPHPIDLQTFYLLTAACYHHHPYLTTSSRRQQLLDLIFEYFITHGFKIRGWVILPNHYHLLVYVHQFKTLGQLFKSIHEKCLWYVWKLATLVVRGKTTQATLVAVKYRTHCRLGVALLGVLL